MADIYLEVGEMSAHTDTTKVALKFQLVAKKLLEDKAIEVINATAGFTRDPKGQTAGYRLNAKLAEIVPGSEKGVPSATCNLTGEVVRWPKEEMVSTKLTGGTAAIGNLKDRYIKMAIQDAMENMLQKSVLPKLKQRP